MKYVSQSKQDRFLDKYVFKGKKNGTFLDIGAYDGLDLSNTYYFEKELDWTGICVEPLPHIFARLQKNRNCVCVNACISNKIGNAKFMWVDGDAEMLSGLLENVGDKHAERVKNEAESGTAKVKEIDVACVLANDICRENGFAKIDYCNIDVEGSEEQIVKSIDLKSLDIYSFTIENNYNDTAIREYLAGYGYTLIGKLGCDDIFIKNISALDANILRIKLYWLKAAKRIYPLLGIKI